MSWVLGSAATQLPALGNLVFRLSADNVTGLSNGASLTTSSWKDSVNNIAVDTQTGTAPTFQTNVIGGKPSVRFPGSAYMSISSPGALRTAIDSQTCTILIAAKTITGGGSGGLNGIFGASAGAGSGYFFYSENYRTGVYVGNDDGALFAGTSFFTVGAISNVVPAVANTSLRMLNGTSIGSALVLLPTSGGNTFNVGSGLSNTSYAWNGDLFEVLVWNVALTPAQYMQAQRWVSEKYGQAYPWAGISKMPVFFGDSITSGVGASNVDHYAPTLAASSLGITWGQYQNLGIGGLTMDQMTSLAPTYINPIAAQFGGKIGVVCWEWANQQDTTTTKGALMLAALKAASNIQTVFGTSTSASTYDNSANRASYNSAWDAMWAGAKTNMDAYMSIHTDSHIGVNGSYATYSGTTGGDGLHLTDTTYPYLAALFTSGFNALPA